VKAAQALGTTADAVRTVLAEHPAPARRIRRREGQGHLSEDVSRAGVLFAVGVGLGVLVGGPLAGSRSRLGEQPGLGLDEDAAADQAF
jgi:hypothetical protein